MKLIQVVAAHYKKKMKLVYISLTPLRSVTIFDEIPKFAKFV